MMTSPPSRLFVMRDLQPVSVKSQVWNGALTHQNGTAETSLFVGDTERNDNGKRGVRCASQPLDLILVVLRGVEPCFRRDRRNEKISKSPVLLQVYAFIEV